MLFSLNLTLVLFVLSFLVFMALFNAVFLKPVGEVIARRNKLIESELEGGKNARLKAQALLDRYEEDLKKIRHEAHTLLNTATQEANQARSNELARIAKEGQAKLEKAKTEIAAERERLIDALVGEEAELVETITRKVLGDDNVHLKLDAGQVRRTLEEI